jgi:hypothetical protein
LRTRSSALWPVAESTRISRSVEIPFVLAFAMAVTRVRDVPARLAISACVSFPFWMIFASAQVSSDRNSISSVSANWRMRTVLAHGFSEVDPAFPVHTQRASALGCHSTSTSDALKVFSRNETNSTSSRTKDGITKSTKTPTKAYKHFYPGGQGGKGEEGDGRSKTSRWTRGGQRMTGQAKRF